MFGKKNTTYSNHPTRASRLAHKEAKKQFPTYDTSLIQPKKSKKPIVLAVVAGILLVGIIVGIICLLTLNGCSCAPSVKSGETVEITVEEGSTAGQIGEQLAKAGLITNAADFTNAVVEQNATSKLKSGVYVLEGGKTVDEYVQIFIDGPDKNSPKLVVAEGMKLKDIADAVEKASKTVGGNVTATDFKNATSDASKFASEYTFLKDAGKNSLEGFLFPKTYTVKKSQDATDIAKMMLDQFSEETKNLDFSYPQKKGLNLYEAVTLASIVEKESASGTEKKVASVFYNRMDKKMYLNSDATTAYEVGHDPTPEEVHSNSPYSTYTNYGLPPTPICSPGKTALEAVCYPDETDYLYFYFKKGSDGQMEYKFSKTYEEHQQAIASS